MNSARRNRVLSLPFGVPLAVGGVVAVGAALPALAPVLAVPSAFAGGVRSVLHRELP
ncbi:hypothetical protein [Halobaculum rubrum]|uniref:hypothetical protein n=1 Tax=Halobaculum rubrum TaxID=2872158 RepID=UPI001CA445A8|nr:hypothetical protein [Halobaculum rubrum]QZX98537.1 hypothetical protein K6T25_09615 [Halobaculum rubrum]